MDGREICSKAGITDMAQVVARAGRPLSLTESGNFFNDFCDRLQSACNLQESCVRRLAVHAGDVALPSAQGLQQLLDPMCHIWSHHQHYKNSSHGI